MRHMYLFSKYMTSAFLFIAFFTFCCIADITQWPSVFTVPKPGDSLPGMPLQTPNRDINFLTQQSLYDKSFSNNETFTIYFEDSLKQIQQNIIYELDKDFWLRNKNQILNISGNYLRKKNSFIDYIGVEWRPLFLLNMKERNNNNGSNYGFLQSLVETGPTIGLRTLNIPITLSGGLSDFGWHDSVPASVFKTDLKKFENRIGVYGNATLSNPDQQILSFPVFINGEIHGSMFDHARQLSGLGTILFFKELASDDSVFIYCADTMNSGADIFIAESFEEGVQSIINSFQSKENSFQAAVGLKGKKRFKLFPSAYYSFSQYKKKYPLSSADVNKNVKNNMHTVGVSLATAADIQLYYEVSMALGWEKEDKLFDVPKEEITGNPLNMERNLEDYRGFHATTRHSIAYYLDNDLGFTYNFYLSRYLREYPVWYTVSTDSILKSDNDEDDVFQQHKLEMTLLSLDKVEIQLQGDFIKNLSYKLNAAKSAHSFIDRHYGLSSLFTLRPFAAVHISELISAGADVQKLPFLTLPDQKPSYGRSFISNLQVRWDVIEKIQLSGTWIQQYWEEGFWHDQASVTNNRDHSNSSGYFAIEEKSMDYTVMFASTVIIDDDFNVGIGIKISDVYYRSYNVDQQLFIPDPLGSGYQIVPFLEIMSIIKKRVIFNSKIKLNYDTEADNYWDIQAALKVHL